MLASAFTLFNSESSVAARSRSSPLSTSSDSFSLAASSARSSADLSLEVIEGLNKGYAETKPCSNNGSTECVFERKFYTQNCEAKWTEVFQFNLIQKT